MPRTGQQTRRHHGLDALGQQIGDDAMALIRHGIDAPKSLLLVRLKSRSPSTTWSRRAPSPAMGACGMGALEKAQCKDVFAITRDIFTITRLHMVLVVIKHVAEQWVDARACKLGCLVHE